MTKHTIRLLSPAEAVTRRGELEDLLVDSVDGGASVNFILPMTRAKAARWWDGALASHAGGERLILVADDGSQLDGTVQIVFAGQENQPFRAEIAKMLVHSRARRQGLGEALMRAAEREALARDRTLLVLDTETGGAGERLYARCGWTKLGEVPGFALDAAGGRRLPASFFFKQLTGD